MALLPLPNLVPVVGRLAVLDDYGPIGRGASAAHEVCAENGAEYLMKGPTFSPANPFVGANELIAAVLAGVLGLPVLDAVVLEMGGDLFFGSSYMTSGSFYPAITDPLFALCENRERAYDMYALDFWILNTDRHQENLTVRKILARGAVPERHILLLNDHSHCLCEPGRQPAQLAALVNDPPARLMKVAIQFVADSIQDPGRLSDAIAAVEAVSDGTIEDVVSGVPDQLLPGGDRQSVIDYLIARRTLLRALVRTSGCFPNLTGPLP